jgi:DNA-binding response OmpR family regulator
MFLTPPMIWLVDESRSSRRLNLETFKKTRCVVTSFKRGLDAVLRLQSSTPHLIGIKRTLPDGCGIGYAAQLRTANYRGIIVLLSSEDDYKCRAAIAQGLVNIRMGDDLDPHLLLSMVAATQSTVRTSEKPSLWSRLTRAAT